MTTAMEVDKSTMSGKAATSASSSYGDVDTQLQSRSIPVWGLEAIQKMSRSTVLVVGGGALGVEISKNICLAGVKRLTIADHQNVTMPDLGANFYLTTSDIGRNRAVAVAEHCADLNSFVQISSTCLPEDSMEQINLISSLLDEHQVLVSTSSRSMSELLSLSEICRSKGVCFISCDVAGLFGRCFVDFGTKFIVSDVNGEEPITGMIAHISSPDDSGHCVVAGLEEHRHGLESGDVVTFGEVLGMKSINGIERSVKVLSPYTFSIGDMSSFATTHGEPGRNGYFRQIKKDTTVEFKSLKEALVHPEICVSDFGKMERSQILHLGWQALYSLPGGPRLQDPHTSTIHTTIIDSVIALNQSLPEASSAKVSDDVIGNDESKKILTFLSAHAGAELNPMCAVFGGIVAQEVLKAVSSKFMPIKQFLYFDALECIDESISPVIKTDDSHCPVNSRYDSQIVVFGTLFQQLLGSSKIFVVGAGALGCEVLKNLAMMGVACKDACSSLPLGVVHITDMDTIEKSNLNRQFLFRSKDIGGVKSVTAASAVKMMNPSITINALTNRVGPETEHVYNDEFMESLDVVINALDNVQARLYVDSRCVYYQKPLLEEGTLGTKGNVQVIVPFLTESYGSSRDPPESSIPICTLKHFPYAIEHTLQWARDYFEGIYTQAPNDVNNYVRDPSFLSSLSAAAGRHDRLLSLQQSLVSDRPCNFYDCISWARFIFEDLFVNSIKQLLFNFPADMLTSSGVPFWSPPKRAPTPLVFNVNDATHLDFVVAAAVLRAENYSLSIPFPYNAAGSLGCSEASGSELVAHVRQVVGAIDVPVFVPKAGVAIPENDQAAEAAKNGNSEEYIDEEIIRKLPSPSALSSSIDIKLPLRPTEFDKDNDDNCHMRFISSCSNLRGRCYEIQEADFLKSKVIAGKIIPAIATTTAMITGFVCFEAYKLIRHLKIQKLKIEAFKNGFVNLALPFFGFSEPIAAPCQKIGDWSWSLWDRFDISVGKDITLRELMAYFESKYQLTVSMLAYGSVMLYTFFMAKDKLNSRLDTPVGRLAAEVSKIDIPQDVRYLIFNVCCDGCDGDEVDVPYVRYRFRF